MTHDPHKNYYSDWQTPPEWLTWVEAVLGPNYFDPCPADWDGTFDGLMIDWGERVYCNPPGANSTRSVKAWWEHAAYNFYCASTQQLVWCFFNNEHTRHVWPSVWTWPGTMVIPRKRVGFLRDGVRQESPRNWTWFWVSGNSRVRRPPVDCFMVRTGG